MANVSPNHSPHIQCPDCYWTKFHVGPYKLEDVARLCARVTDPCDPGGYPRHLRPRSPTPERPTNTQAITCATPNCQTQSGSRTAGNRNCIEQKCKKCCAAAARLALERRRARKPCKAHQQPAVNAQGDPGSPASSGAFVSPPSSPVPHRGTPPAPPAPPVPVPSTPASTQNPPASRRPITAIPPPQPTQRCLAQPLGGAWLARHTAAAQQKEDVKSLKILRLNMDERSKRTVTFVIWFEVCCVFLFGMFPGSFSTTRMANHLSDLIFPSHSSLSCNWHHAHASLRI